MSPTRTQLARSALAFGLLLPLALSAAADEPASRRSSSPAAGAAGKATSAPVDSSLPERHRLSWASPLHSGDRIWSRSGVGFDSPIDRMRRETAPSRWTRNVWTADSTAKFERHWGTQHLTESKGLTPTRSWSSFSQSAFSSRLHGDSAAPATVSEPSRASSSSNFDRTTKSSTPPASARP